MIVSSFFEGRVRLKASLFKNSQINSQLKNILLSSNAVQSVTVNEKTGSMLIEYSPSKIPLLKIKKTVPLFEKIKEMYDIYGVEAVPDIIEIIKEMDIFFNSK